MTDRPGGDGSDEWFSLVELTSRLGGLVWIEKQLAEVVGTWSGADANPRAQVLFAEASRHHGWHAEIVGGCLPTSEDLNPQAAVRAPTQGWGHAVDQLGNLSDPESTVGRLLALTRVVDPWIARETGALVDLANPVSDRAMTRWFRFVDLDHDVDHDQMVELVNELQADTISLGDRTILHSFDLS